MTARQFALKAPAAIFFILKPLYNYGHCTMVISVWAKARPIPRELRVLRPEHSGNPSSPEIRNSWAFHGARSNCDSTTGGPDINAKTILGALPSVLEGGAFDFAPSCASAGTVQPSSAAVQPSISPSHCKSLSQCPPSTLSVSKPLIVILDRRYPYAIMASLSPHCPSF